MPKADRGEVATRPRGHGARLLEQWMGKESKTSGSPSPTHLVDEQVEFRVCLLGGLELPADQTLHMHIEFLPRTHEEHTPRATFVFDFSNPTIYGAVHQRSTNVNAL